MRVFQMLLSMVVATAAVSELNIEKPAQQDGLFSEDERVQTVRLSINDGGEEND